MKLLTYLRSGTRGPLEGRYGRDPPGASLALISGIANQILSYSFVHVYDDIIASISHRFMYKNCSWLSSGIVDCGLQL